MKGNCRANILWLRRASGSPCAPILARSDGSARGGPPFAAVAIIAQLLANLRRPGFATRISDAKDVRVIAQEVWASFFAETAPTHAAYAGWEM